MQIKTKQQFYELWLGGLLGNHLGAWRADGDLTEARRLPMTGIRSITIPGAAFRYPVARDALDRTIAEVCAQYRCTPHDLMVCEGTPEQYDPNTPCAFVVQGELTERLGGWYFFHSFVGIPMRAALANHGRHAEGYGVQDYLRRVCTPDAYADIVDLLALYPGCVIELSVHSRCLGLTPHRNTIVWEVRHY